MLKFDKLVLITNPDFIKINQTDRFNYVTKKNELQSIDYKSALDSTFPNQLRICQKQKTNELLIEFSGKMLYDDYPKLITAQTIKQCLDNITNTGICTLNSGSIINNSQVLNCDVTSDIDFNLTTEAKNMLKYSIANDNKWGAELYKKNGIVFNKKLETKRLKERLIIYDKYSEMAKSVNKKYLCTISNPDALLNYFKNKTRFELNLKSIHKIKEVLQIPDNNLNTVLNSKATPLLNTFNNIISDKYTTSEEPCEAFDLFCFNSITELNQVLLLKACDNDLTKLESVLRHYYSAKSNFRKIKAPYKKLLLKEKGCSKDVQFIELIRVKLAAA